MPYIKPEERAFFTDLLGSLAQTDIQSVGELNFLLTKICLHYINQRGLQKYQFYNDVIGALEASKMEIYRKLISPYEEQKEIENGTVWK